MADEMGCGMTLTHQPVGGGSETQIFLITDLSWSNLTNDIIDITTQDSGAYKEFEAACHTDPGEVTLEGLYDSDVDPLALIEDPKKLFTLKMPLKTGETTPVTFSGNGIFQSNDITVPYNDKMTRSITIKWAGAITFTAAT
jgi:hypothetical protein